MSGSPTVSVIVVLHESRAHVDRCLTSLRQDPYRPREIIVVDNASTDGAADHVAAAFPEVRILRSPVNLGFAGGINLGLQVATGPLIAPLNADVEVGAPWLAPMARHLRDHPEVGAVTPLICLFEARDRVNAAGGAIHPSGLSFCRGLGEAVSAQPRAPFPVPGISGASYVVRRSLLEPLGGAPEWCFMGNDDVVLSWQLRLMGAELTCVPEARVYHRYHLSMDPGKLRLLERNRWALLLSALSRRGLLGSLPRLLALEGAILGYSVLKGPAYVGAKAGAWGDVLRDIPRIQGRRIRLQGLRRVSDGEIFAGLSPGLQWRQLLGVLGPTAPRGASQGGD